MSWKLVFGLSLFGLVMAFGTVFFIAPSVEPFCWGGILLICAFLIAKRAPGKHFLHGVSVGLSNSVWVSAAHIAFFDRYLAGHPAEAALMTTLPSKLGTGAMSGQALMAATGPAFGLVSGILLGVVAYVLSKFIEPAHSEYAGW